MMITSVRDKYNSKIHSNFSITVFTADGKQSTHTSFEHFEQLSFDEQQLTTRVRLEYNFILYPKDNLTSYRGIVDGVDQAEKYKVVITLNSKVGLAYAERLNSEFGSGSYIRRLIFTVDEPVSNISIEYVDRIVGEQLLDSFNKWVMSCEKNEINEVYKICQKHSSGLMRIVDLLLVCCFLWVFIDRLNNFSSFDNMQLAKYLISSLCAFYLFVNAYRPVLSHGEFRLDTMRSDSYIKLTTSDERIITKLLKRSKKSFIANVVKLFIYPVLIGVLVNYISLHIV